MTIVCGTDFSSHAAQAVRVASLWARASGETLYLVHAVEPESGPAGEEPGPDQVDRIRRRLDDAAGPLKQLGLQPATEVVSGRPDEALVQEAGRLEAGLLVVGAVGHRAVERWLLGSCADRTAREAPLPVLVVREARPFEEWLVNGRALRVVVGCEEGPSSDRAVVWAGALGRLGTIDLCVARMALPGEENRRAGVSGEGMGVTLFPATQARLVEKLRDRTASLLGDLAARLEVIPALGRTDQHLVGVAADLGADLVVVGSHQREGFRRWWHGSVSSGVLHGAPMSVAVVPVRPPAGPDPAGAAIARGRGMIR